MVDAARARGLLAQGELDLAVHAALESFGPEVFGFLVGVVDDVGQASVLYAHMAQRVAHELEAFRWDTSLRTWMYGLARSELLDGRRRRRPDGVRREGADRTTLNRTSPLDTPSPSLTPVDTSSWRPRLLLDAVRAVRKALTEEERELLILRVDRGFAFVDIALMELGAVATSLERRRRAKELRTQLLELRRQIDRMTADHLALR
jgi:DNA-directed RNA polymerase specialized sigma24 family protein